jgi:trehalose 6-phosphate phosphatase
MTPLFSEAGCRRLDDVVKPGVLCAFDFDGTLSPIVMQPEKAYLPPDILRQLVELSTFAPIAIITGRSIADIRPRLAFEPDYLVGNHGLEGVPGWEQRGTRNEEICRGWEKMLSNALKDRKRFDEGVRIENKQYSLSVHYRLARDHAKAQTRLSELFSGLEPPARVIPGKSVFSLLPQDAADKGTALEQLMNISGARSVIYVGDDITDEDVFRLKRNDLLSVRIEHAPGSAAEFFLNSPRDIMQLLDTLIMHLRDATNEKSRAAFAGKS